MAREISQSSRDTSSVAFAFHWTGSAATVLDAGAATAVASSTSTKRPNSR